MSGSTGSSASRTSTTYRPATRRDASARRLAGSGYRQDSMGTAAAYDEIADWYEREFLGVLSADDPLGITRALTTLLGTGSGACMDIGCGTGVYAEHVDALGWTPVGVDLSAGMLRHASGRLPVVRADAKRLPVRDASLPAVVAVM